MPTTSGDLTKLTKLGHESQAERRLEVFPNHAPGQLTVTMHCTEFTCFCPVTHQPDYATIDITYQPDQWVVESKSLKLYLETFRNEGVFHEHLAYDIGQDVIRFAQPLRVKVEVKFNVRGGIAIEAAYEWQRDESSVRVESPR